MNTKHFHLGNIVKIVWNLSKLPGYLTDLIMWKSISNYPHLIKINQWSAHLLIEKRRVWYAQKIFSQLICKWSILRVIRGKELRMPSVSHGLLFWFAVLCCVSFLPQLMEGCIVISAIENDYDESMWWLLSHFCACFAIGRKLERSQNLFNDF